RSASRALEELGALRLELLVGQEACLVQVLELAEVVEALEIWVVLARHGSGATRTARPADRVRVDAHPREPLPQLRDPEAARRQPLRLGAGHRPTLDEATI